MGQQQQAPVRVAAIIGTRPEAIKMAPVLRALRARGLATLLLCTRQHPLLDLPGCGMSEAPDGVLGFDPSGLGADAMCAGMTALAADWLAYSRPDLVLVQGDTNSALAGARAAWSCGIPLAHVEAGLRTFDLLDPWPEERNRVEIDANSDLLFAPTEAARRNLHAEGVRGDVLVCGNSGMDALIETALGFPSRTPDGDPRLILVTVHRRENRGAGISAVADAMRLIAAGAPVAFAVPLHPNAGARAEMIAAVRDLPRVHLLEPQSYREMVELMLRSALILSDSGGLQEEAPALGRPLLVLRASTERPEAIASGNALLVGTEPARVAGAALTLLEDKQALAYMNVPAFPFGAGGASAKIALAVEAFLATATPPPLDPVRAPA